MALLKLKYGSSSALSSHPFTEGTLYFVYDSNRTDLYADLNGSRRKLSYDDSTLAGRVTAVEQALNGLTDGDNLGYGS